MKNMARDRIQINGKWYVEELPEEENVISSFDFIGHLYETDDFCFEATKMSNDDGKFFEGFHVEFTDKRTSPWKKEFWDNHEWVIAVYNGEKEPLKDAIEIVGDKGVKTLRRFVENLKEKGWL